MDKELLEQLYRRYYAPAMLYCTALCGDQYLAQDIVADAFVKACISLPDDVPSFRYWLLRVCRNLWIDHQRRQKHFSYEDPSAYISGSYTPETEYLKKEQHKALWRAMDALSPPDRELVVLHYFSGLSLQEIAPMINISYAAVRQRMVRLRRELKIRLEEQGYGTI